MVSLQRRQVLIGGLATAVAPAFISGVSWAGESSGKLVLSGRILGADARPVSGATVAVGGDQVATDGDGRFVLLTTKGQPYRVTFAGQSGEGLVADARRDVDGTWRASFALTLA